ncbi:hypothetical protein HMJ29_10925 [Hymenobacter taeanensis]|uniref:Uncharacterized protein n=1 Tax=Hymenobacter taeanensis TaxID=2735321 RepID=A0A6M6BFV9_9BACT|nr:MULTISPECIES: hypothetical protein [Hymenobacter]QJX47421.1 hypothetical protein HMJ29_10925 [Hymenobacter taeanensis]UOQ83097.1 hypothetical protein MUN83_10190 [Hymenobacter sp. 5414T-23]
MQLAAIITGLSSLTSLAAHAQKLPVPGQKNPDWKLQKTEELFTAELLAPQPRPVPMPSPKTSGGTLDSAGNWHIWYDPEHNVRYNLEEQKRG